MIIRSSPARLTELLSPQAICVRCLRRLSRPTGQRGDSASLSTTVSPKDAVVGSRIARGLFKREYFLANGFIGRPVREARRGVLSYTAVEPGRKTAAVSEQDPSTAQETVTTAAEQGGPTLTTLPQTTQDLPHRRKQRLRHESAGASTTPSDDNPTIPLDASSRLSTLSSTLPTHSVRRLLTTYLSLSKPRLTFLIVLTTTTAYSLYPVPALLLPSTTAAPSLSTLTLLFLTTGTTLSSACANALNMIFEPAHDAKMSRTRNRPLVRGLITPFSAYVFALTTGCLGLSSLYLGVNPTVAFLSALNIGLYALVYTPLKRLHPINTWVGALVGAIPPLMGWAAAAGQTATATTGWQELLLGPSAAGGWLLAGLLFAWQFPHFNALSWSIREEYKAAGYQMLAWTNPRRNARVALRYAVACVPMCVGLWWVGVTDAGFVATSGVANAWLVRQAWWFWRKGGAGGSARGLFWASVWHLPVVMVLAMGHKKGLWDGVWKRVVMGGEEEEEEEDDGEDDDDDDDGGGLPEPLPVPVPGIPGLVASRTT